MKRLLCVFNARAWSVVSVCWGVAAAHGDALYFNATTASQNEATRSEWLAACGIQGGTYFEDFERIELNTNLHGVVGVLRGDLTIWDTSSAHAAYVRGSASYFGGTAPLGTRAVAHNEGTYLELDLEARPVDYVGGYDIDHTTTAIVVVFVDDTTASFSMDSGSTPEFWGFWRNDRPKIKRVKFDATGDGEWGLDNLEFGGSQPFSVNGVVSLGDWVGDTSTVSATFEVRSVGSANPLESVVVPLAADGSYSFTISQPAGTYDVFCKPTHWLKDLVTSVSIGESGATGVDFSVVNGDVDGDNMVTVFDYNALSDAFDSVPGNAHWNANADLDGDLAVTVFDYNILSANFDRVGDD